MTSPPAVPVALSLISSKDQSVGDDVVAFGEIGLAGEIRSVSISKPE